MMVKKVNKFLTKEQIKRGVIFSSTLSTQRTEMEGDTVHEVKRGDIDTSVVMDRLLDDKFFNKSPYKYNIVRRPDYRKVV